MSETKFNSLEDVLNDIVKSNAGEQADVDDQVEVEDDQIDDQTDEGSVDVADEEDVEQVDGESQEDDDEDTDEGQEDDELEFDWEDEETDTPKSKEEVSFSDLAKELGFDGVKNKDEVKAKIDSLRDEVKNLSSFKEYLDKIPSHLKDAVKIAVEGDGDYLSYLGITSVDYNKVDDATLLRHHYSDAFVDEQGNLDADSLDDYLDSLDDATKRIQVKKLRNELVAAQKYESDQKLKASLEAKEKNNAKLRDTLKSKSDIFGLKINDAVKDKIYSAVTGDRAMKEMFYDDKGQIDPNKVVDMYFFYKNQDKIMSLVKNRTKHETKKEIFEKQSNVTLKNKKPESYKSEEKKTGLDLWLSQLKNQARN